jgi:hypothetical protein
MTSTCLIGEPGRLQISRKDTIIKGRPTRISCVEIKGQNFKVERGPATVIALEDEWYEDLYDPFAAIETLRQVRGFKPDIFTFWQRIPDTEPKYSFYRESEDLAVLPITTYEHWWNHQIKSRVRNQIKKCEKEGVQVREVTYDDDFVRGMTRIFNETPIRQGRHSWHYGKSFEQVKSQFSRYVFRELMLGAYCQGELVGFVMLGHAGRYALTGQILSSLKHRDKAISNALVAKCVEICEKLSLPHLVYFFWLDDSLSEFKRRCGFQRMSVPRYFVPLTTKGRLILKLKLHRGWKAVLPSGIKDRLKRYRRSWNNAAQITNRRSHMALRAMADGQ